MGREIDVSLVMETRIYGLMKRGKDPGITAIFVPPGMRGYVFIESRSLSGVYELASNIKYVKSRPPLRIPREDIERLIKPPPAIEMIREGETVEIVRGPFRDMRATVISVNKDKNTVLVKLLDAIHEFHVEIPGDYVKPLKKSG